MKLIPCNLSAPDKNLVFRKTFWLSEKALAKQRGFRPGNLYVLGALHRNRKRLPLNSTTASNFATQSCAAGQEAGSNISFQGSAHYAVSQPRTALQSMSERRDGLRRSVIETFARGQSRGRRTHDLEKNETQHTTRSVPRTRSGSPSVMLNSVID